MKEFLIKLSNWSVPLIILIIPLYGYIKGVKVYESFTDGVKDGLQVLINIFPNLLAMILAIRIFQYSGTMEYMISKLDVILELLHIPEPVLPLLFLRSLSGSGSLSYVSNLLSQYGPDSFIGKLASTIQGSTETTFYIIAIYFGAIGIKKYRYSIIVGLLADISGFFAAIFICKLFF